MTWRTLRARAAELEVVPTAGRLVVHVPRHRAALHLEPAEGEELALALLAAAERARFEAETWDRGPVPDRAFELDDSAQLASWTDDGDGADNEVGAEPTAETITPRAEPTSGPARRGKKRARSRWRPGRRR